LEVWRGEGVVGSRSWGRQAKRVSSCVRSGMTVISKQFLPRTTCGISAFAGGMRIMGHKADPLVLLIELRMMCIARNGSMIHTVRSLLPVI